MSEEERKEAKLVHIGPKWDRLPPLEVRKMPEGPVGFAGMMRVAGPGWIQAMGSIGSGEIFFWPTLTAMFGPGIMWAHNCGAMAQLWMSQEARRYAVATGESLNQACERIIPHYTYFRMTTAVIGGAIPGWAALAATSLMAMTGIRLPLGLKPAGWEGWCIFNVLLCLLIQLPTRVIQTMLRRVAAAMCVVLIAMAYISAAMVASPAKWAEWFVGTFSQIGWIPSFTAVEPFIGKTPVSLGVSFGFFCSAVAYAYSAPTIGFGDSQRLRDAGHGMGAYRERITGLFGKREDLTPAGYFFDTKDPEQVKSFNNWMKANWLDNGVFGLTATLATAWAFSLGSFAVLRPAKLVPTGIKVAVSQAEIMKAGFGMPGWYFMIFLTWLTLWTTQLSVFDGGPRNVADMLFYKHPGIRKRISYRGIYWGWLGFMVVAGFITILSGLAMPGLLISINAFLSFIEAAPACFLTWFATNRMLPKEIRPHPFHSIALLLWGAFYTWLIILWLPTFSL